MKSQAERIKIARNYKQRRMICPHCGQRNLERIIDVPLPFPVLPKGISYAICRNISGCGKRSQIKTADWIKEQERVARCK